MPLLSRRIYHRVLTFCVGLGVGTLSGTAVFHLLPQAFDLLTDGHGYISKSWMAIVGIYLFFFTDRLLKLITEHRHKKKREKAANMSLSKSDDRQMRNGTMVIPMDKLNKSESTVTSSSTAMLIPDVTSKGIASKANKDESENGPTLFCVPEEVTDLETASEDGISKDDLKQAHGMCSHDHEVEFHQGDSVIAAVAWMIIFGDGLHNFIDGLSIGAAFTKSTLTGLSVSLAVLCEEFPHELGDIAILLNAGMTIRQALTYNLLSAVTCYFGFVIGVLLGELVDTVPYIFALAAGMFLYISLASMVPEMNQASDRHMGKSTLQGIKCIALQASGVLVGLVAMFLMAYYGSNISLE